jgi:hypothetical protein
LWLSYWFQGGKRKAPETVLGEGVKVAGKGAAVKTDGEASSMQAKQKKSRMTELQKLQGGQEDPRKTRNDKVSVAKSGKEKHGKVAEESGKAVKEKASKERPQSLKAQKVMEKKVDDIGKKSKKGSSSNVKVRNLTFYGQGRRVPGLGGFYTVLPCHSHVVPHNLPCMFLQNQKAEEDAEEKTYAEGDIVEVLGFALEEEEKVVAIGKVKNVEGGSLHGITIEEGCASVQITKSLDSVYMLFKSIDLDDPAMTTIGKRLEISFCGPLSFCATLP